MDDHAEDRLASLESVWYEIIEAVNAGRTAGLLCPECNSPDGLTVSCSVHGTLNAPRQQTAPSEHSPAGRTMRGLSDLTATLTFMEDGLHAVLVVNRK